MDEAALFARYLLGVDPDATSVALYRDACALMAPATDARDERIARFACEHPAALAFLDAGLALRAPDALLRRKLHVMAAILETRPAYARRFLPRDRSPLYALCIVCFGARAALKAAAGLLLLRAIA